MKVAPLPAGERERLAALHALKILDTPDEERFDRITRLAKRLLNVPIVLISLVDEERQWFKSRQGLDATETSRDVSFCAHAILDNSALVVPDVLLDERFADNPLVTGEPRIRFYAGYPVSAPDGNQVGTLCIIDRVKRVLTEEEAALLKDLAVIAENELNSTFLAERRQEQTRVLQSAVRERTLQWEEANTRLKRESLQRERADEMLSAVLDTVGEGIITIDADGIIVMLNREAETIFDYKHEELMNKPLAMLMPEKYRQKHRDGLRRYKRSGISDLLNRRVELEGLRRGGIVFPLEFRIRRTALPDNVYFTASVRDISERKELELMRDEFVATVSHELRTPLASVMGWTETLMSERPGPLSENQRRFLDIVYKSSERLDNLVEEILTVSRIQSGTLQLSNEPFYAGPMLEGVLEMMESATSSRAVSLRLENRWPDDLAIIGDGKRMGQVLINLVGNAVKFSPENSEVCIDSWRDGDRWRVEIGDQGIGIAEEEISHLFERFYRAQSAKEAQIQGTGIGLYVCKAIVEGHKGEISVDSKLGEGTTVRFTIPVGQSSNTA